MHSRCSKPGDLADRGTLDIQNRPSSLQEHRKLSSLDFADLFLIGSNGKNRDSGVSPKLSDIIHFTIHHSPTDARSNRSPCHLGHPGADRLDQNCVRALGGVLDYTQQLLALIDGVVAGIDDLNVCIQAPGSTFGGRGLFLLVVIVICNERNQHVELRH